MVLAAAKAAREGKSAAAGRRARGRGARAELKMWFAIDTLEFLRRGGRIGAASAWIGSTLKVKPILTVENEMTPVERVRTSGRAFERMVDYARQRHESGADAWCVQHINAPDQSERLVERCREVFGSDRRSSARSGRCCPRTPGPGCSAWAACPRASCTSAGAASEPAANSALMELSAPGSRPHRADRRLRGDRAVPDLPAAQADRLDADRHLPGGRAVAARSTSSRAGCGAASPSRSSTSACSPSRSLLIALIVPPLITEANNFADNVPAVRARRDRVRRRTTSACASSTTTTTSPSSSRRRRASCPSGSAAPPGRCATWASGSSTPLFALVTILVLTAFLLGSGRTWVDAALALATTRAASAAAPLARQHGRGGGRLRGRRADDRGDRRASPPTSC